jgi:integrase/recombinase XerD
MTQGDLLRDFKQYLQYDRQLTAGTIHNYLTFSKKCQTFIDKDFYHIERDDVRRFIRYLEERGHCKATIANHVIALRSFYVWMSDATRDPHVIEISFYLSKILKIRKEKSIPVVPSIAEIKKLRGTLYAYKKATSFSPSSDIHKQVLKEIAMIELLITTGLRSNELRHLCFGDVNLETGMLMIRVAKGSQQRVSLFNGSASAALKDFFESNHFERDDILFPIKQGNILNYIIKKWSKRASINQKIHAHSFRHFYITETQRQGVEISVVADQVGHRNLNTTRSYTHLDLEYRRERLKHCKI